MYRRIERHSDFELDPRLGLKSFAIFEVDQKTRRRREMNKWEVDEHKQWCEKVRSKRFCPPLLDKNRNYEGILSNKRKSFVKPMGMNGSNFKNETIFASFLKLITHEY